MLELLALLSYILVLPYRLGGRFSKAPETFGAHKAIFN